MGNCFNHIIWSPPSLPYKDDTGSSVKLIFHHMFGQRKQRRIVGAKGKPEKIEKPEEL